MTHIGPGFVLQSRRSGRSWLIPATVLPKNAPSVAPPPISLGGREILVRTNRTPAVYKPPLQRWIRCQYDACESDARTARRRLLGISYCQVGSLFEHDGAVWARSWCPDKPKAELVRAAEDGSLRHFALPVNDRSSREVICGDRLVVALESSGTLVWDLENGRALSVNQGFGRFGNSNPAPPVCSPDGEYVAVATPYSNSVTIVRLVDGARVESLDFPGAGQIRWTDEALFIQPVFLPLE